MSQKKTKGGMNTAQKVGIGFGLTAAAVTAAGAYFLYGSKQSVQNRKKIKGWMLKAKGEVLEALEKAESITEEEYKALVETASGAYSTMKNATAGEVKDFKKEMGEHWEKLQKNNAIKKLTTTAKTVASKNTTKKDSVKTKGVKTPPQKAVVKVSGTKKK